MMKSPGKKAAGAAPGRRQGNRRLPFRDPLEALNFLINLLQERNQHCCHCGSPRASRDSAEDNQRRVRDQGQAQALVRPAGHQCGPAARVPREPEVPKKPPSPFLLFCRDERPRVSAQNTRLTSWMITCMLGQLWRDLDPREKAHYFEQAAVLRLEHRRAMASYGAWQRARESDYTTDSPETEEASIEWEELSEESEEEEVSFELEEESLEDDEDMNT